MLFRSREGRELQRCVEECVLNAVDTPLRPCSRRRSRFRRSYRLSFRHTSPLRREHPRPRLASILEVRRELAPLLSGERGRWGVRDCWGTGLLVDTLSLRGRVETGGASAERWMDWSCCLGRRRDTRRSSCDALGRLHESALYTPDALVVRQSDYGLVGAPSAEPPTDCVVALDLWAQTQFRLRRPRAPILTPLVFCIQPSSLRPRLALPRITRASSPRTHIPRIRPAVCASTARPAAKHVPSRCSPPRRYRSCSSWRSSCHQY